MTNTIYRLAERPDLRRPINLIHGAVWPRFMQETDVAGRAWDYLFEAWAEFQVALCDEEGNVIAAGHSMPLVWDGTAAGLRDGWDEAAEQAMQDHDQGRTPNALSAYAIVVDPAHQGRGHSSTVLKALTSIARDRGFQGVIACVRPTLKAQYPLAPFERYIHWKNPDGLPFDPWIRVHARAGALLEKPCPKSMIVTGKVDEWEEWTGLRFPESGPYVLPGALQPIEIDIENDQGRYEDPNVWMIHRV